MSGIDDVSDRLKNVEKSTERIERAIYTINHSSTVTAEAMKRIASYQCQLNDILDKLVENARMPWKWLFAIITILGGLVGIKLFLGL